MYQPNKKRIIKTVCYEFSEINNLNITLSLETKIMAKLKSWNQTYTWSNYLDLFKVTECITNKKTI